MAADVGEAVGVAVPAVDVGCADGEGEIDGVALGVTDAVGETVGVGVTVGVGTPISCSSTTLFSRTPQMRT